MKQKILIFSLIIFFTFIGISLSCQRTVVDSCPNQKQQWENRSREMDCLAKGCHENEVYHCVRDENGNLVEVCTRIRGLPVGLCPYYDTVGKILQFSCRKKICGSTNHQIYYSTDVFRYQECIEKHKLPSPSTPLPSGASLTSSEKTYSHTIITVGVFLGVSAVSLGLGLVYKFRHRAEFITWSNPPKPTKEENLECEIIYVK